MDVTGDVLDVLHVCPDKKKHEIQEGIHVLCKPDTIMLQDWAAPLFIHLYILNTLAAARQVIIGPK